MADLLKSETINLFVIFVMPGLVSMLTYRLFMPARHIDWGKAIIEGMFYSCVHLILMNPLIRMVLDPVFQRDHPTRYYGLLLFVLLIVPMAWPAVLCKLARTKWLTKGLRLPFPTAWDYFFDKRVPLFALVHLQDGRMIAGFFGVDSYATSFPNEGDLYLEALVNIEEDGTFGSPLDCTRGLLIRKDQYSFIEFFDVPQPEGDTNG